MKPFVLGLVNWSKKQYNCGTILGKTIELGYSLLSNSFVQSFINLVFATIAGLFFFVNKAESDVDAANGRIINWRFLVPCIICYFVFSFIFYCCQVNVEEKGKETLAAKNTLSFLKNNIRIIRKHETDLNGRTADIELNDLYNVLCDDTSFFDACDDFCESLHLLLNEVTLTNRPGFKVQIFIRNITEEKDSYRMVGYAPKNGQRPETYQVDHDLKEYKNCLGNIDDYSFAELCQKSQKAKVPCHAWPFLSEHNDNLIIFGAKEVADAYYKPHKKKPTSLHIAIPVVSVNTTVLTVLQITSRKENSFGNSKDDTEAYLDKLTVDFLNAYEEMIALYQSIICNQDNFCKSLERASENSTKQE